MSAVSRNIAYVIGPLLHGSLYDINISYPFWIAGICCFIAAFIVIGMITKWSKLKNQSIDDRISIKLLELIRNEFRRLSIPQRH